MLVAWARKKRRSKKEYEDEIVSALFGPLLIMSSEDRAAVIRSVAEICDIQISKPDLNRCTLEFWPNIDTQGLTEPDLLVHFGGERRSILIIEAKWDSGQSGRKPGNDGNNENQLKNQWNKAKKKYRGAQLWHVFLTKEPQNPDDMGISDNAHRARLRSLSWMSLAEAIFRIDKNTHAIRTWKQLAGDFLSYLGYVAFSGLKTAISRNGDRTFETAAKWTFHAPLMHLQELRSRYESPIWAGDSWKFNGEHQ